jgi:hypothetical protein
MSQQPEKREKKDKTSSAAVSTSATSSSVTAMANSAAASSSSPVRIVSFLFLIFFLFCFFLVYFFFVLCVQMKKNLPVGDALCDRLRQCLDSHETVNSNLKAILDDCDKLLEGAPASGLKEELARWQRMVSIIPEEFVSFVRDVIAFYKRHIVCLVQGVASAGKSTLFNALVGHNVTPTEALEGTTIVPIFVYHHDSDVTELCVSSKWRELDRLVPTGSPKTELVVRGYQEVQLKLSALSEQMKRAFEQLDSSAVKSDLRECVTALLEEPSLRINTKLPARFENLVLVDCPGLGDRTIPESLQTTLFTALTRFADMTLLLVPVDQVMKRETLTLVDKHRSQFACNTFLCFTKYDILKDKEASCFVDEKLPQLCKTFAVDKHRVAYCAARLRIFSLALKNAKEWEQDFEAAEQWTRGRKLNVETVASRSATCTVLDDRSRMASLLECLHSPVAFEKLMVKSCERVRRICNSVEDNSEVSKSYFDSVIGRFQACVQNSWVRLVHVVGASTFEDKAFEAAWIAKQCEINTVDVCALERDFSDDSVRSLLRSVIEDRLRRLPKPWFNKRRQGVARVVLRSTFAQCRQLALRRAFHTVSTSFDDARTSLLDFLLCTFLSSTVEGVCSATLTQPFIEVNLDVGRQTVSRFYAHASELELRVKAKSLRISELLEVCMIGVRELEQAFVTSLVEQVSELLRVAIPTQAMRTARQDFLNWQVPISRSIVVSAGGSGQSVIPSSSSTLAVRVAASSYNSLVAWLDIDRNRQALVDRVRTHAVPDVCRFSVWPLLANVSKDDLRRYYATFGDVVALSESQTALIQRDVKGAGLRHGIATGDLYVPDTVAKESLERVLMCIAARLKDYTQGINIVTAHILSVFAFDEALTFAVMSRLIWSYGFVDVWNKQLSGFHSAHAMLMSYVKARRNEFQGLVEANESGVIISEQQYLLDFFVFFLGKCAHSFSAFLLDVVFACGREIIVPLAISVLWHVCRQGHTTFADRVKACDGNEIKKRAFDILDEFNASDSKWLYEASEDLSVGDSQSSLVDCDTPDEFDDVVFNDVAAVCDVAPRADNDDDDDHDDNDIDAIVDRLPHSAMFTPKVLDSLLSLMTAKKVDDEVSLRQAAAAYLEGFIRPKLQDLVEPTNMTPTSVELSAVVPAEWIAGGSLLVGKSSARGQCLFSSAGILLFGGGADRVALRLRALCIFELVDRWAQYVGWFDQLTVRDMFASLVGAPDDDNRKFGFAWPTAEVLLVLANVLQRRIVIVKRYSDRLIQRGYPTDPHVVLPLSVDIDGAAKPLVIVFDGDHYKPLFCSDGGWSIDFSRVGVQFETASQALVDACERLRQRGYCSEIRIRTALDAQ